MWFISFHGGSGDVNTIKVYSDTGVPAENPDLFPPKGDGYKLTELRGFCQVGDLLYVVNAYKKLNQVLCFQGSYEKGYTYQGVYASGEEVDGIFHPYDITFDTKGCGYISSQDSNVVTGLSGSNIPMPIAPFLIEQQASQFSSGQPVTQFLAGTRVASATGALPNVAEPAPPNVPIPQGLSLTYTKNDRSRVGNSVRGVLCHKEFLLVSDETADTVKVYNLESGELQTQIMGGDLQAPVQLLERNNVIYIGSSGNGKVMSCDFSNGIPAGTVTPTTFIPGPIPHISGIAFDTEGNFYAAERTNKQIMKYTKGSTVGEPLIPNGLPDNPEFILYVPDEN